MSQMWTTPKQIRALVQKRWDSQQLLKHWLQGTLLFPYVVALKKPNTAQLSQHFGEVQTWINTLRSHSSDHQPNSYQIQWQQRNTRQLGPQTVPSCIVFFNAESLFGFIKKQDAFCQFTLIAADTLQHWPQCKAVFIRQPLKILALASQWPLCMQLFHYFDKNPLNRCYLRQLAIPEIDSKFIESNKKLISDFLLHILPEKHIDPRIEGLSGNAFEQRFGFLYDEPCIRFRILDAAHSIQGLSDISLPLSQFSQLTLAISTVFITENKINGLAFPRVKNAIVIFGLGYGVSTLRDISWLRDKDIVYWGDIDTHGFVMLDLIRTQYPQTRSLLMDQQTVTSCQALWVTESSQINKDLTQLTDPEQLLYQSLLQQRWADKLRLEQERIPYPALLDALQSIIHGSSLPALNNR